MTANKRKILWNLIWYDRDDYPEEHKDIIVCDKYGKEYDNHQWSGHFYYNFIEDDKGNRDGWISDVDIVKWRYICKE